MQNENSKEIIKMYCEGLSSVKISKHFDIKYQDVLNILKINNIEIRGRSSMNRKYTINENYFDIIDSKEKVYILGFLYADGYNHETKGSIVVSIHKKDISVLEFIKKELKYDFNIKVKGDNAHLYIYSKKMSKSLAQLGCFQNKTHFITYPNFINPIFDRYFILGYFDGDGCLTYSNNKKGSKKDYISGGFSIVGNLEFLKSVKNILINNIDINLQFNKRKENGDTIYNLYCSGNRQLVKIMDYFYSGNDIYFFERKYKKFLDIKKCCDDVDLDNKNREKNKKDIFNIKKQICDIKINDKKIENEKILKLYLDGNSMNEICKTLKIGKGKINKILEENNIEVRNRLFYEEDRIKKLKKHFYK